MTTVLRLSPVPGGAPPAAARYVERDGWRVTETFTSVDAELAALRGGCGLADQTANGRLLVEGQDAAAVLARAAGAPELGIGSGAALGGGGCLYRLRADLFFASTPTAGAEALADNVRAARAGRFVTVTDISPGGAELLVLGPAAPALLSKLCGLDFGAFPDGGARQTSVAKTGQLIVRRDRGPVPAFALVGARSLGRYLWDALLAAGKEWQIAPVGEAALRALAGAAAQER